MLSKRMLCQTVALTLPLMCTAATVNAGNGNNNCKSLPDYNALKAALVAATAAEMASFREWPSLNARSHYRQNRHS